MKAVWLVFILAACVGTSNPARVADVDNYVTSIGLTLTERHCRVEAGGGIGPTVTRTVTTREAAPIVVQCQSSWQPNSVRCALDWRTQ